MTRAEVRSEIGDLLAARNPEPNGGDQWLAAHGPTTTQGDARESICIALFRAAHPDGVGYPLLSGKFYRRIRDERHLGLLAALGHGADRRGRRQIHSERHDQHG